MVKYLRLVEECLNIVVISKENDLSTCKVIGYDVINKVNYNNIYFRKDIGFKALI